ncbi:hypothetical protein NDN08_001723 [Rhodosorus marinus]|uniref:C2H2-type domain-containing protein n=1 Tax=Rhodosorus marinus TaxID=101924 RepID=A0AAV8UT29_9RHOD|nr:hypothetical protein NDN08_001723 [Rhodosorus marinus]
MEEVQVKPLPSPVGLEKNEKNFFCSKCLTNFAAKANLRVHVETVHSGLQPYTCGKCDRSFGTNSSMTRHNRIVHQQLKPYDCVKCSRSFATKSCLKRHRVALHKDKDDKSDLSSGSPRSSLGDGAKSFSSQCPSPSKSWSKESPVSWCNEPSFTTASDF